MRSIRKGFAIIAAAGIFLSLTWFFGIFLQPQGELGAGVALTLIGLSALGSLFIYRWLAGPGRLVNFAEGGDPSAGDKDWGVGLVGASQAQQKRRRDDDFDDHGGRRSSKDVDDGDWSGEDGII